MWVENSITGLWEQLEKLRELNHTIALVPTMGALHDGHLSLIKAAKKQCDHVLVSIFVNPTQFGPKEDFSRYPRTLDKDLNHCRRLGVKGVFSPDPESIYPEAIKASGATVQLRIPALMDDLEGKSRPGHFEGVLRVVMKLFNIIQPDAAFFGQKDYQQLRVIEAMVSDLNLPIDIEPCPTIREKDGLAMSSRNRYLSESQREKALAIYLALSEAKALLCSGSSSKADEVEEAMRSILEKDKLAVEYAVIRDAMTLGAIQGDITENMLMVDDENPEAEECPWGLVALVAVKMPENEEETSVRLIDNMLVTLNDKKTSGEA